MAARKIDERSEGRSSTRHDGSQDLFGINYTHSDHMIAGPHGALLATTGSTASPDRWSFISTHTMVLRRLDDVEEPVDFETAIEEIGHGCFQYKLMFLAGFVYACCSLSTTTLSMVLPAAQYDFQLTSSDKGVLNTAPLWGMMVGAYVWGNFADSKGRRFVLIWALTIDAIAAFLSSLSQHYEVFYVLRIFNGFGIIGATSIVFAYMGEFLDNNHRDTYLARLELFWTLGIIALPCMGMAILPWDISLGEKGVFVYDSWRMFVFACGIPSTIAVLLILRMPESPRFLLLQGKLDETRDVLAKMFVTNSGKTVEEFPVKVLSESPESDTYHFEQLSQMHVSCWVRFKSIIRSIWKQHLDLLSGRSLFNIIITCYVDFGLISVYYTMMLWVPELLNRQKIYADENPDRTPTLCEISAERIEDEVVPDTKIKMATFVYTIVTCLACLPTTLMLLSLIAYVSKKILLVGIMLCSAIPAICLTHVTSVMQTVAMLSLLKSFTNLAEAVLFCSIVQIFPINTRGTALSLTVTVGRLGSVVGNVVFGYLIDKHCYILFYGMGLNLILSGLACLLLPKMRKGH